MCVLCPSLPRLPYPVPALGTFVYALAIKNHKICIKRIGKKAIAIEVEQQAKWKWKWQREMDRKGDREGVCVCKEWQEKSNVGA